MMVRVYVEVELSRPVAVAELDGWAQTLSAEFGERLRLDAPVESYRQGWELSTT